MNPLITNRTYEIIRSSNIIKIYPVSNFIRTIRTRPKPPINNNNNNKRSINEVSTQSNNYKDLYISNDVNKFRSRISRFAKKKNIKKPVEIEDDILSNPYLHPPRDPKTNKHPLIDDRDIDKFGLKPFDMSSIPEVLSNMTGVKLRSLFGSNPKVNEEKVEEAQEPNTEKGSTETSHNLEVKDIRALLDKLFELADKEIFKSHQKEDKEMIATHKLLEALEGLRNNAEAVDQMFYVQVFELCKNIEYLPLRRYGLIISGTLIYAPKKIRLDPVNESEFLNALSYMKEHRRALEIWESRRIKSDVKDARWWQELGVLLYIAARDFETAVTLTEESIKKYDYLDPNIPVKFIQEYCKIGQVKDAMRWFQDFKRIASKYGVILKDEATEDVDLRHLQTVTPQFMIEHLNAKTPATAKQFNQILRAFFRAGYDKYGLSVLKVMDQYPVTRQNIGRIVQELEYVTRALVIKSKHDLEATDQNPLDVLNDVVSKNIKENPEMLKNSRFYLVWLHSLGHLGESEPAVKVLDEMISNGIPVNSTHIQPVIKALLKNNKLEKALEFLEEMEKSFEQISKSEKSGIIPPVNAKIYSLFIKHFSKLGQSDMIQDIMQRMKRINLPPDQTIFMALIYHEYKLYDYGAVFDLYEYANSLGFPRVEKANDFYFLMFKILDKFHFTQQINRGKIKNTANTEENSETNTNKTPLSFRQAFRDLISIPKVSPSIDLYSFIFNCFLEAGDIVGAMAVAEYMGTVQNMSPNMTIVLKALNLNSKKRGNRRKFYGLNSLRKQIYERVINRKLNDNYTDKQISWKDVSLLLFTEIKRSNDPIGNTDEGLLYALNKARKEFYLPTSDSLV